MAIFNDKISILLKHRLHWLSAKSQVMTENIAHADMKGVKHTEIRPFKEVLKRHRAIPNKEGTHATSFKIGPDDIIKSKKSIARENEMLQMSHNAIEHDAIVSTIKNFHQLVKTILSMSQGG